MDRLIPPASAVGWTAGLIVLFVRLGGSTTAAHACRHSLTSVDTESVCSAWHKRWLIIVVQQHVAHGTAEGILKTAWLLVSVVVVESQRLKLLCLFVRVICWRATDQSMKLWRLSLLCAQGLAGWEQGRLVISQPSWYCCEGRLACCPLQRAWSGGCGELHCKP